LAHSAQFRSGGAAVDVGPDLLWVGARAIVLAGHLLNSFVRNRESRRERLFSRYQQKCRQNGRPYSKFRFAAGKFLRVISMRHENSPEKSGIELMM
jgi:hypothetical protein